MKYGGVALTKTSELRAREVICVNDGRKLGLVTDLEIDLETGKIRALVVPGKEGFFWWLGKGDEVVIPWENIRKIGVDVILVESGGLEGTRAT